MVVLELHHHTTIMEILHVDQLMIAIQHHISWHDYIHPLWIIHHVSTMWVQLFFQMVWQQMLLLVRNVTNDHDYVVDFVVVVVVAMSLVEVEAVDVDVDIAVVVEQVDYVFETVVQMMMMMRT